MIQLDPFLYSYVHLAIISFLTVGCFFSIVNQSALQTINSQRNFLWILLYSVTFIIAVGLRPISGAFVDTINYAQSYYELQGIPLLLDRAHDKLFSLLMWWCAQRMSVEYFFLIVEILYVIPIIIACKRLCPNNYDIAVLFSFAAFSFFTYGVNGIRNGMACSLVLLAITLIEGRTWDKIVCAILSIIAINTHASTALPVVCMLVAFLVKSPKVMFVFWVFSIFLSLIAGGPISNMFANLGFDERLSDYITADVDEGMFSRTGFRWDFLLYSSVPIVLGYYLIFKKKVFDRTYLLLLGTYIYANAFWIMVIRAEYSNRFAYLSWFLYPIVLCYPLLRLKIWPKTQGRKTAVIMAGHLAFTLFMTFVYK